MGRYATFFAFENWQPAFVLWLIQGTAIFTLATVNPNHYTTVDSGYYLSSAQALLDGEGYVIREDDQRIWNGYFPPGYSLCIAGIAFIFQVSVLWASKVVNWLASGLLIYFFQRKFSPGAVVILGAFLCSGIALKLWVHTWSEPLFLSLLFIWCYYYSRDRQRSGWLLFGLGSLLIMVRYAGIFIVPVLLLSPGNITLRSRRTDTGLALGLTMVFLLILWNNYSQSGEPYGGSRFTEVTSLTETTKLFMIGLINEILLIRDINGQGIDWLSFSGIILQTVWCVIILKSGSIKQMDLSFCVKAARPFISMAFCYLIFLFVLRLFSPFDAPGYRLLSPFTFLIITGCLSGLTLKENPRKYFPWIFLIIISWLHLLPS